MCYTRELLDVICLQIKRYVISKEAASRSSKVAYRRISMALFQFDALTDRIPILRPVKQDSDIIDVGYLCRTRLNVCMYVCTVPYTTT